MSLAYFLIILLKERWTLTKGGWGLSIFTSACSLPSVWHWFLSLLEKSWVKPASTRASSPHGLTHPLTVWGPTKLPDVPVNLFLALAISHPSHPQKKIWWGAPRPVFTSFCQAEITSFMGNSMGNLCLCCSAQHCPGLPPSGLLALCHQLCLWKMYFFPSAGNSH